MDSFWVKVAIFAAVMLVGVIIVGKFISKVEESVEPEKTYQEVIKEDDKRLRAEPNVSKQRRVEPAAETNQPQEQAKVEVIEPQFKELSEVEKVDAEKLFEMAIFERKTARLPGMSYKKMVDYCRQIIQKYPDSVYAYKARRMLGEVPERLRKQYNITEGEIIVED